MPNGRPVCRQAAERRLALSDNNCTNRVSSDGWLTARRGINFRLDDRLACSCSTTTTTVTSVTACHATSLSYSQWLTVCPAKRKRCIKDVVSASCSCCLCIVSRHAETNKSSVVSCRWPHEPRVLFIRCSFGWRSEWWWRGCGGGGGVVAGRQRWGH